jgi:hypothetical protein
MQRDSVTKKRELLLLEQGEEEDFEISNKHKIRPSKGGENEQQPWNFCHKGLGRDQFSRS